MSNEETERKPWPRPRRRIDQLGDKVERLLKPIVEVLDDTLGTNIKKCSGCARRREWLNNLTKSEDESNKDI